MYWTHPDVFEAEVDVVNVEPGKVRIEPILFHPDEGGQPADKGTIGGAIIRAIQVAHGDVIHTLDRALPDGRHPARVDREHRFHTATQHTAQHILSGIALRQFGLKTVGVHIGLEGCTVDFHEKLGWDVAADLERQALDIVMRDLPVETSFGGQDVQARSRPGPIESDVIRIVTIGDCDVSACCGAHVRTTGRIGVVRVFDIESKKAGTRVSFLAGKKALEQCRIETAVLRELRGLAACASAELPATLARAIERSKDLTKEVSRIWSLRLSDLAKSAETVAVGSTRIGIHTGELPRELVSTLAGMIAQTTQGAGIVVSDANVAVSSVTLSASDLLRKIQSHAGGKGGGSPKAANGRLDRTLTTQELTELLTRDVQPGGAA